MTSIGNSNNQIQIWNNMEKTKKTRIVSQKKKPNKYSCRTIFTPNNLSSFFTDFSRQSFRCTIASILKQKTLQSLFFLGGGGIWFSDWVRLFLHQYQKILPALFCGISVETRAFCYKIAAVNLNSQQNFYDNGASAVLRTLTALSAELPAILRKITANLKKISTRAPRGNIKDLRVLFSK